MLLYHGSGTGGIQTLRPSLSNHGKPYVYLTPDPNLAVIYAHKYPTEENCWFSYLYRDGQLHYEEYFSGQLEEFYQGAGGYVYACKAEGLERLDKMPWVYLSEAPVPVTDRRYIPSLYDEIIALGNAGRIIIDRYDPDNERCVAVSRRLMLKEIEDGKLREHPDSEYARFIHAHFPDLL